MANHVALLGDSILDNGAYVRGGPDVVRQVRDRLPINWDATLLAVDGSVTRGVIGQLARLPRTATHLVVSSGGNDALDASHLLGQSVASVAEAVSLLDLVPDAFDFDTGLSSIIANPDAFTVIVALAAGAAGMLSLLTAKSGALVGVLISVTTIPASAQIALSVAFREWESAGGAAIQLASNVVLVVVAGTATLLVQRAAYRRRQQRHRGT
jgi:hypothetical protein